MSVRALSFNVNGSLGRNSQVRIVEASEGGQICCLRTEIVEEIL